MPKARFNLLEINYGTAKVTSGSITLAGSYFPGALNTNAIFIFEVPLGDSIYKKFWKSLTIKGYKRFSAEKATITYSKTTFSTESEARVKTISQIYGGTALDNVINREGVIFSEGYNDSVVEDKIEYGKTHVSSIAMTIDVSTRYPAKDGDTSLTYQYKFTIEDVENCYLEIDYDDFGYNITPVFPVNTSIKPTQDNNFAFQISSTGHSRASFSITDIRLTIHQNGNDYPYVLAENQTFLTVMANTLVVGQATYEIVSNNTYDEPNTSGIIRFAAVGPSEAPTITGVTQDAFPVISWTSANQKAWQLIVRGAEGIVFDSGIVPGSAQSFKMPSMLSNGAYYAEVRILNVYGYYTDWGTYGFVMNTTAPGKPTNIIVSVTNDYGVAVNCEAPADAGTLYVIRRPSGTDKSIIIGEYFNGFVDYTIPINTTYEYTVRNYNVGYADGEWIDATVNASGIIIRDGRNIEEYINLWKVENGEFNLISNNIREKSLLQCVGRTYPVKESSEWIESTRVVEVFVPYEVYEKLRDMATNSKVVYLQNRGEFLTCDMEISDQGEYITKGRITQILLTRIDEV